MGDREEPAPPDQLARSSPTEATGRPRKDNVAKGRKERNMKVTVTGIEDAHIFSPHAWG